MQERTIDDLSSTLQLIVHQKISDASQLDTISRVSIRLISLTVLYYPFFYDLESNGISFISFKESVGDCATSPGRNPSSGLKTPSAIADRASAPAVDKKQEANKKYFELFDELVRYI